MAGEDEKHEGEAEIKIHIDPDPDESGSEGDGVAKSKSPADDLSEQLADLKKKNETEASARADAERRAAEAHAEAQSAHRKAASAEAEVQTSHLDTLTTALDAANAAIDAAQKELEIAIEVGDAKKQSEAQVRISKATATAVRLEEAKDELEHVVKNRKEGGEKIADLERKTPTDPVEAYAAGRPPQTQAWLRKNRDYVIDPRKNAKLNAAHFSAMGESIEPGTDAYFEHLNEFLGLNEEEQKTEKTTKKSDAPKRRETPAVAPGGNGATNRGSGGAAPEVRLTKSEATRATDGTLVWNYDDPSGKKRFKKGDPIGVQEFARRKHEMQKQGLYDKSQYEAS